MNLTKIQTAMHELGVEAWLLMDFRGSNSIAWNIINLPANTHCTRRWAVLIPQAGEPTILSHAIESFTLQHLDGHHIEYSRWTEWQAYLQEITSPFNSIAMEYSPMNDIPVNAKVDAGSIELLRSFGKTIVSSATLVQQLSAVWTAQQLEYNLIKTAPSLHKVMAETATYIAQKVQEYGECSEYEAQQYAVSLFAKYGLCSDSHPIVAIGKNAASPHYAPHASHFSMIKPKDIVLIDMWAKLDGEPQSTYSDITSMFYIGEQVPEYEQTLFSIIAKARDKGIALIKERFADNKEIFGYEVDDAVRSWIDNAGYGQYFIHRTGHSITTETHGSGTNMDNYETKDTRPIIPGTSFSIEPGIYIRGEIGMRTEVDVIIDYNGKVIIPTDYPQQYIHPLYAGA